MYKPLTACRACPGGRMAKSKSDDPSRLLEVFDMGLQPLANDFVVPGDERAGFAPLKVMFCPNCGLAQLSVVVRPDILYKNYNYVTSPSETMMQHFIMLWREITQETEVHQILEIGSNDGAFLQFAKQNGAQMVVGVDPAENLAAIANDKGIFTYASPFDSKAASMIALSNPSLDVIVARHVFAHVDNWHEFVESLDKVAYKETLIVIEVPYVLDLLEHGQFSTIYHEHLSYVNLHAIRWLLDGTPFQMHKVLRCELHGGSVIIMLRRRDYGIDPHPSVRELLKDEHINPEDWSRRFKEKCLKRTRDLSDLMFNLVLRKKRIVGFCASAKSTVWINTMKFSRRELDFIVDCTPQKQGKLAPGTNIPIVDPGALLREQPDYAICFASGYREEILKNNKQFEGQFIFPEPRLEIIRA